MASKRRRTDDFPTSMGNGPAVKRQGKGKGKGLAAEDNPFGIAFRPNNLQRSRYETLVKRQIVSTRYLDEHTLTTLGLLDDVKYLFHNVGWDYFMTLKFPAYEKVTLEFLSSLNAEILQGKDCEHGLITFRLFNNEHSLNLAQFNDIFKFPVNGERRNPKEFKDYKLWTTLTTRSDIEAGKSKASCIRHPCFRYIHRFMSSTLFGRGGSDGAVRQVELLFLWAMLTREANLDTGSYMIRHMLKIAKPSVGKITLGGLITAIALHLGYEQELSALKPIPGKSRLDIEACINMNMIVRDDRGYSLLLPDSDIPHPLPDPERTNVKDHHHWSFPLYGPEPQPLAQESLLMPPPVAPPSSAVQPNELAAIRADQKHMARMVEALYNWHLQQYPGQFQPPPQ